jgi:ribonuclease P protein component
LERTAFILLWQATGSGPGATAILAGRKLGGSVVRNRARRRLREAYRLEKAAICVRGVNACIVARKRALTVSLPALRRELAGALSHVAATGREA